MRLYNATNFVFRRNYALRMFALCFGAVHVPLISFIVVSATRSEWDVWLLVTVTLATVVGSGIAIVGIAGMLAPVTEATRTLRAMRDGAPIGRIPVGGPDMAGELLETVAHAVRQTNLRLDELQDLADSDPLTGLGNRRGFVAELARRAGIKGTLVVLDGDRFKAVNDLLGHVEGDRVLRMLALRLGDQIRPDDIVARWGGDEFTIFFQDLDRFEAQRIVERLQSSLRRRPVTYVDGKPLTFTAGYGWYDSGKKNALENAFTEADKDMYARKAPLSPGYVVKSDRNREIGHVD